MRAKTDVKISMNPEFLRRVQNAAKAGVRDCFKQEILPDAKANSPREMDPAELARKPAGYVHNAESIGMKIRSFPGRVAASIFTQSGHGGYLEKGTSKMAAQPYLFPAVQKGLANLAAYVRARIEQFSQGNVEEVPDEVISGAVSKIRTSTSKGVGIIGAREAKKKQIVRRLKRGL